MLIRPFTRRMLGPALALPEHPQVSVLFGTYNRFPLLRRAVESIRSAGRGVSFEIIVTDGGSTDGSREWLAAQPDVVLIGHRRLEGAVHAFNAAYDASKGIYVANFNDDSVYKKSAITQAVRQMDANPDIAQGVFAFNLIDGNGKNGINQIYPGHAGTEYANFGITRRSALEKVVYIQGGFWNPSAYRTYAADCEQSAWLHALGEKVEALEDCFVVDIRTQDGLRVGNESRQPSETKLMYHRWPLEAFRLDGSLPRVFPEELERFDAVKHKKVPQKTLVPMSSRTPLSIPVIMAETIGWPSPREEERLIRQAVALRKLDPVEGKFPARVEKLSVERVLYVSLATREDPQAGLERALRKLGSGGFAEVRWYTDYGSDPAGRQAAILKATAELRPTLVFCQLQTPNAVNPATIRQLREIVNDPRLMIVSWCGDIADINSPFNTSWQIPLGRVVDITLHSSLSHVHILRAQGIHACSYLQIGYDPKQYHPFDSRYPGDLSGDSFDICFLGSKYGLDNFSASMKWHDARLRNDAVLAMREIFKDRFGLFGRGWGGKEQTVPLDQAHTVYHRSRMGLSVSLANYLEAYSSDRLHRILGCGCLALVRQFPLLSTWGLIDGENCAVWTTPNEAVEYAKALLAEPDRLQRIAEAGAKLAKDHLSWETRMFELSALLAAARGAT